MKYILELEIDPFNEHLALECELSIRNGRPIMYWCMESSMCELPVKSAELKQINRQIESGFRGPEFDEPI